MKSKSEHFGVLSGELAEHPLFKQALGDYFPLISAEIEDWIEATKQGLKELERTVTPKQMYKMLFYQRLSNLHSAFVLLDECVSYLNLIPSPMRLANAGLCERDWLQYHYTMFLMSITAIADCSMLLVAEAYEVGIHPTDCKINILANHRIVGDTDAYKALNKVYQDVDVERRQRNPEFHRMERTSIGTVLEEPGFELWGSMLANAKQLKINKEKTDQAQNELKRISNLLQAHLRERGRGLIKLVHLLFTALTPVYDEGSGLAASRVLDKMIKELESEIKKQNE